MDGLPPTNFLASISSFWVSPAATLVGSVVEQSRPPIRRWAVCVLFRVKCLAPAIRVWMGVRGWVWCSWAHGGQIRLEKRHTGTVHLPSAFLRKEFASLRWDIVNTYASRFTHTLNYIFIYSNIQKNNVFTSISLTSINLQCLNSHSPTIFCKSPIRQKENQNSKLKKKEIQFWTTTIMNVSNVCRIGHKSSG